MAVHAEPFQYSQTAAPPTDAVLMFKPNLLNLVFEPRYNAELTAVNKATSAVSTSFMSTVSSVHTGPVALYVQTKEKSFPTTKGETDVWCAHPNNVAPTIGFTNVHGVMPLST